METSPPTAGFSSYLLVIKRRWLPGALVFVTIVPATMLALSLKPPIYNADGQLKFARTNPTSSLTGVGQDIGSLQPLGDKSNPLNTEAEVIRSLPIVQATIGKLNLRNAAGKPLQRSDFLSSLTLTVVPGTDILKVTYKDRDPQRVADIVNTLMAVYLENNIRSHRTQTAAAREFIENQLPQAETQVSEAEESLREFKEANAIVALKEEAVAAVNVVTDLQKVTGSLQAQIADTQAQMKILQGKLGVPPQESVALTALSQTPGVQDVLKELQQVEATLAIEGSRFQAAHPKIATLTAKRTALQALLQERIAQVPGERVTAPDTLQMGSFQQDLTKEIVMLESKHQGLIKQLANLFKTQAAYRQRTNTLPRLEQVQRQRERQLEAAQATYLQLLQKRGEIRIAENQNVGNVQIISSAQVPDKPTDTKTVAYLAATLLGLLVAGGVMWILELRDQSIKTIEQAQYLLEYTLLGVIPRYQFLKKLAGTEAPSELMGDDQDWAGPRYPTIAAAYRILQANLKFLSSDQPLKVIAITSSVPQEGKSTISANLAVAIAQLGQRVLLVDADMYRPIQHRIWRITNETGLSNMLVEQIDLSTVRQPVMPHLDVLPAGVVPPNALALLDSQRMASLVKQFAADYDFVIFDTPPLNLATEALILGKMADGILLVVRPDVLDIGSAKFAKGLLTQSGQRVLGQVVNDVVAKYDPHSNWYFANESYTHHNTAQPRNVPDIFTREGKRS
jgi:polysaccharide biosynthesis transport protein